MAVLNSKMKTLCVASALALAGCGLFPDGRNNDNPDLGTPDADVGVDAQPDANVGPDVPDMEPDACVPIEACAADTCGELDDGCGGTLDCGACECVDGQPTEPSCGPCGLGTLSCGADVTGVGTCQSPSLGEVDIASACVNVVYVAPGTIMPDQDGTKDKPYAHLSLALEAVTAPAVVVVSMGSYEDPGTLNLAPGVHVVGGYDPTDWSWSESNTTTITVSAETPVGLIGLNADGIDQPTVVAHISVVISSPSAGVDAFGVRARDAGDLVISSVSVTMGDAAEGTEGADGTDGTPGEDGQDAPGARQFGTTTNAAGFGGQNNACPAAAGGAGGRGSYATNANVITDAQPGAMTTGGAQGGAAGTPANPNGERGGTRPPVQAGADGQPGRSEGAIVNGVWKLIEGNGTDGAQGFVGSGGGGGGGSWWPSSDPAEQVYGEIPGASGGGGGAGGCGGGAGVGGLAGGSTIAFLAVNSTGITLVESTFVAGAGGDGGRGGRGGRGGAGGEGGEPTKETRRLSGDAPTPHPSIAGRGGSGTSGGEGGNGGSGAGGSSYGGFCDGTVVRVTGNVTFRAGTAGRAGQGLVPAEDGRSVEEEGCL